jgi:hypothetical protein
VPKISKLPAFKFKLPQNMKNILTFAIAFFTLTSTFANLPTTITRTLNWSAKPLVHQFDGVEKFTIQNFDKAVYNESHPSLPYFSERFKVNSPGTINVELLDAQYESFEKEASPDDVLLSDRINFQTKVQKDRREYFAHISFIPIIKTGPNTYERLVSFTVRTGFRASSAPVANRGGETYNSKLSSGDIYKIAVAETGMHKLTYDFLKNELEIPIDDIDPRKIQILGNGGGVLPVSLVTEVTDDLAENAVEIVGEGDGSFDENDYILFYGQGASVWTYSTANEQFEKPMNFYDNNNYYFIKIGSTNGKRVTTQASVSGTTNSVTVFDAYMRYEEDRVNLMHDWSGGQGSGQQFFGDFYKLQTEYNYSEQVKATNLVNNSTVKVMAGMAARALTSSSSRFSLTANGNTFTSNTFSKTGGDQTDSYANYKSITETFTTNSTVLDLAINYSNAGSSSNEAWLDFIQINYRQRLEMTGNQMAFREVNSQNFPNSEFKMTGANGNITIWDITDLATAKVQNANSSGTQLTFGAQTEGIVKEFVAFDKNTALRSATAAGQVENQNIHGIENVDFVIIYHEDFLEQAEKLAKHRMDHSDMAVAVVDIRDLENEFSSGRRDASGIRNFARMLYDRSDQFKTLLLFGDGSFDQRNIYGQENDFIPVYETPQSLNPVSAYPSDDFYTILDEGETLTNGSLDIAVGRLPVKDGAEADLVVDKVICYDTAEDALGDWRNRMVFVADDEDNNTHVDDADEIADKVVARNPNLNVDKIYLDAFPQESTPGGTRIPLATAALNRNIFKGVLAVTYLGHGGSKGWTQERVLKLQDILGWENSDKLPLFITATCSFAGYDNPAFTTGGEEMLLNRNGGAVALFSTTRAVYASANARLTQASVDTLFYKINNQTPTIGEVLRISKNKNGINESNSRKFALLGDPSMSLALPNLRVTTNKINGVDVNVNVDTIRALQKVTVEGEIQDDSGNFISDFNGIVVPTIFDKQVVYQTLGQDASSPVKDYVLQKNIIFKGKASVTNGKFSFTFVVPKDIDYNFGDGKISYYAYDNSQMLDAAGHFIGPVIGGTDLSALSDNQGPTVDVYMNSEDFVYGGITDSEPTLLVVLEDDNGINVTGNSIGHDLSGVLDQNSANTFILNDFYEAELDDYTKGKVRFPLSDLAVGEHEIRINAWDIANNNSEGFTKFTVVESEKVALERVLNYPNPFTTNTCFMFQHNMGSQDLDVLVSIYTISGRLVKTIETRVYSEGFELGRENCIEWNGNDDFGDPLAKGTYIYKVKVRANGMVTANGGKDDSPATTGEVLKGESGFERLVILK